MNRNWTPEEIEQLRRLYKKFNFRICASLMGIEPEKIKAALKNYKINSGRNGRFEKKYIPWNKNKKGLKLGGEITQFKPGHLPFNTKYNGCISTRHDKSGRKYKYIRISKGKWILYHRYLYEEHNGKIPGNMIVVFRDKNSLNCSVENLELITRKEHARRNHNRQKQIQSVKFTSVKK
jgi:hypothetical protein